MKKFCYRVDIIEKGENINSYYDYCCANDAISSHDIIRILVKKNLSKYLKDYNINLLKAYGNWDRMIYNNKYIIEIIFIEIIDINVYIDLKKEARVLRDYIVDYMYNSSEYYVVLSDKGDIFIKTTVDYQHEIILYDINDRALFKEKIYNMCLNYVGVEE